jgi:excisionase family DNA binding protein
MTDRLLTVEQAAKRLGISRTGVYNCIRNEQLKSLRVNGSRRIPLSAIDELIASAEVGI